MCRAKRTALGENSARTRGERIPDGYSAGDLILSGAQRDDDYGLRGCTCESPRKQRRGSLPI